MTFTLLGTSFLSSVCCRPLPDSSVALKTRPGDHGGGVTPVPIPNTAVKPSSADGTARAAWWESRTSPGFTYLPNDKAPGLTPRGFCFWAC